MARVLTPVLIITAKTGQPGGILERSGLPMVAIPIAAAGLANACGAGGIAVTAEAPSAGDNAAISSGRG
jgi:hypothetical protein